MATLAGRGLSPTYIFTGHGNLNTWRQPNDLISKSQMGTYFYLPQDMFQECYIWLTVTYIFPKPQYPRPGTHSPLYALLTLSPLTWTDNIANSPTHNTMYLLHVPTTIPLSWFICERKYSSEHKLYRPPQEQLYLWTYQDQILVAKYDIWYSQICLYLHPSQGTLLPARPSSLCHFLLLRVHGYILL